MQELFPKVFLSDGQEWHLIYNPTSKTDMLPNLDGTKCVGLYGNWVEITYNNQPVKLFMVTVDVECPALTATNFVRPARMLRGIRFYKSEVDPSTANPQEMYMYIREIKDHAYDSQQFLNDLFGTNKKQNETIDRTWATNLLPSVSKTPVTPVNANSSSSDNAKTTEEVK